MKNDEKYKYLKKIKKIIDKEIKKSNSNSNKDKTLKNILNLLKEIFKEDIGLVKEIEKQVKNEQKIKQQQREKIRAIIAEYDQKAANYGKNSQIEDSSKKERNISTFSNNDELNCHYKRTSLEKKVGDQRSIVDYIDFYHVDNKEEVETEQQTFDVLAVPCDRPFAVAPEKVEEIKNTKANHEVLEQTEEMAEEFRTNNLEHVLKKTRKPNK